MAKPGPVPRGIGYYTPRSQPRRGRPAVEINPELFEKLASIQCTQVEIAGVLGMHITTLEKKLASDDLYKTQHGEITLRELLEISQAKGKASVRRMQMALLEKGNATMAIWLGKNLLGQSDNGPAFPESRSCDSDLEID